MVGYDKNEIHNNCLHEELGKIITTKIQTHIDCLNERIKWLFHKSKLLTLEDGKDQAKCLW